MKKVWISMTGDESCKNSAQVSALDQLSRLYDEQVLGLAVTYPPSDSCLGSPLLLSAPALTVPAPAGRAPHLPGAGASVAAVVAAATGPAPPGTCALATPGRRLQSPPPPPPGSAVTSCSCFPVGPVGLTFDSQPLAAEGARRDQRESCGEGGGVEPGRTGCVEQTAAGVPGRRGAQTPGAFRGFRRAAALALALAPAPWETGDSIFRDGILTGLRFEDPTSRHPLDYAQVFPTQ
nr:zinc finger matrin-type protein 3 isoform X3 [Kogia breviceps]